MTTTGTERRAGGGGPLRVGSVCSGIEAASVAWKPLGFEAAWLSEIDPFCCSVLKHHYPDTPNLGDVRGIASDIVEAFGPVDVVVFGFPCQDLSVAGQRKGLKHEGEATRSGLFFDIMRLVERAKPRWTVVENVPGLFSSNEGRDFACVVGALAGTEFDVPQNGWQNTGVATGPKGLVEWSILDAQWFGVPQRRRRVFLVRDSGDWRSRPPILFDAESLLRNPPPSREAGEGVAVFSEVGSRTNCDPTQFGDQIKLNTETMYPLQAQHEHGVAIPFDTTQVTSPGNYSSPKPGDACHPLAEGQHPPAVAYRTTGNDGVYEQGDKTAALNCNTDPSQQIVTIPIDMRNAGRDPEKYDQQNRQGVGVGQDGDPSPTVDAAHVDAVAFQTRFARNDRGQPEEVCPTLQGADAGATSDMRPCVQSGMAVRRLTPRECERLQGFPDDYTLIPYGNNRARDFAEWLEYLRLTHTGLTEAEARRLAADGPRYRALGNSMAVPVMRWIGQRILEAVNGADQ